MATLLELAKQHTPPKAPKNVSDEDVALAVEWVKGGVTMSQVERAYSERKGKRVGTAYYTLLKGIRVAYLRGHIRNGG